MTSDFKTVHITQVCEQHQLHRTLIRMESNNQQQEISTCECCKEVIKPTIFEKKCMSCAIATFTDEGDEIPDLGGLTIDDILSQDDPPKELYLGDE